MSVRRAACSSDAHLLLWFMLALAALYPPSILVYDVSPSCKTSTMSWSPAHLVKHLLPFSRGVHLPHRAYSNV